MIIWFSINHLIIGVPNFDLLCLQGECHIFNVKILKCIWIPSRSLGSAQNFRGQHWTYTDHQKDRKAIHHIHHYFLEGFALFYSGFCVSFWGWYRISRKSDLPVPKTLRRSSGKNLAGPASELRFQWVMIFQHKTLGANSCVFRHLFYRFSTIWIWGCRWGTRL